MTYAQKILQSFRAVYEDDWERDTSLDYSEKGAFSPSRNTNRHYMSNPKPKSTEISAPSSSSSAERTSTSSSSVPRVAEKPSDTPNASSYINRRNDAVNYK